MPPGRRLSVGRRGRWALGPLVLVAAVLATTLLAGPSIASSSGSTHRASTDVPSPAPGAPWFGPGLDWERDLPADYAGRLGATPSLYAQRVRYPMDPDDRGHLEDFAQQAASQGAVAVLTLEPRVPLADLADADAATLGGDLARLHDSYATHFLVRFAPEMNGSWTTWGQQPDDYVDAFRTVAGAVHGAAASTGAGRPGHAEMVWAPAYGAGYPFGGAYGAVDPAGQRATDGLDTDDDGDVDDADDPYGPYFPGDRWVDWVGLSLYHYGDLGSFGNNGVPGPGDLESRLAEGYGYADPGRRRSFLERYAGPGRPMLVETAALYAPSFDGGGPEQRLKQAWWGQVLDTAALHPEIGAISWLEVSRPEAELEGDLADWRATHTDELAAALLDDLEDSGASIGPVTRVLDQTAANEATAQGRLPAADAIGDELGWVVLCAALLAVAYVVAGGVGRWIPSWRYPREDDPRDQRLDLFRGWIILAVVITHIEVAGPYSFVTLRAIGAITGAEMFVLLSGVVLGMIYEPTVRRIGEWPTALAMWRRARKQYVVALVVVLLVFVIGLLPFVDATVVTTFTDRGTGPEGEAVAGQVYDLYPNAQRLFDYPPPWYAVRQLLLLQMGPWVLNIMGLFVVLSLLLPGFMWLVRRGLWWVLLTLSWAAYTWQAVAGPDLIASQFDDVFPLLTWQLAFTHGLVLGHYRRQVIRALTTIPGRVVSSVFVLGYPAVLVWLWAGQHYGFPVSPFPPDSYAWLYDNFYTRVFLQPGRLLNLVLMLLVAHAVLTQVWKPLNAAIGWFWIPLGQASLYVFVVHVFLVLAVGNIPGLDRDSVWAGTLVHTAVLVLVWVMVRRRILFSVIPR